MVEFRGAKRALQAALNRVKSEVRRELLEILERDHWGRLYRMVKDKMHPLAPPLTRCLQPDLYAGLKQRVLPSEGE